jgi:hypothetical protein
VPANYCLSHHVYRPRDQGENQMRRILALGCFTLLVACGSQGDDSADSAAAIQDQAEVRPDDVPETADSVAVGEWEDSGDEYIEDEGADDFGEPMVDGEPDFADASAPMDDAQGIDPSAELASEESAEDY